MPIVDEWEHYIRGAIVASIHFIKIQGIVERKQIRTVHILYQLPQTLQKHFFHNIMKKKLKCVVDNNCIQLLFKSAIYEHHVCSIWMNYLRTSLNNGVFLRNIVL